MAVESGALPRTDVVAPRKRFLRIDNRFLPPLLITSILLTARPRSRAVSNSVTSTPSASGHGSAVAQAEGNGKSSPLASTPRHQ